MINWWLVIAVGVLLAVVLLLIAALIEAYYSEKRAEEGKRDDWIWGQESKEILDKQKIGLAVTLQYIFKSLTV